MLGALIPYKAYATQKSAIEALLDLNGFSLIHMAVQNLIDAGVEAVLIETPDENIPIKKSLAGLPVTYIQSIPSTNELLNLKIEHCYVALALNPCIKANSLAMMVDCLEAEQEESEYSASTLNNASSSCNIFYLPNMGQINAKDTLEYVLDIVSKEEYIKIPCNDPGLLLDTKTASLEEIKAYVQANKGVSLKFWRKLFEEAKTPDNVLRHTEAVAWLCRRIAHRLNQFGYHLDVDLCTAGGALHDIKRLENHHAKVGAEFLRGKGYEALADIVRFHDGFFGIMPEDFTESSIVCFADKFMSDDNLVTIKKRYEKGIRLWGDDPKILDEVYLEIEMHEHVQKRYERFTGDKII